MTSLQSPQQPSRPTPWTRTKRYLPRVLLSLALAAIGGAPLVPVVTATEVAESTAPLASPWPGSRCDTAEVVPLLDCASVAPSMPPACVADGPSCPPGASESASASPEDFTVEVEAHEFYFQPNQLTVSASGPTTIVLHDTGMITHNFTVDALGIQVVASHGRTAEVTLQDLPPGSYQFYCSISGHKEAGMVGTIVVQ